MSKTKKPSEKPSKKAEEKVELVKPAWADELLWQSLSEQGKEAVCQGKSVEEATQL